MLHFILFSLSMFTGEASADQTPSQPPSEPPSLIRFGMSTALSGPTGVLGRNVRLGIDAGFHEANLAGGINGVPLQLDVLDDGYEPSRTVPNMRMLIERKKVVGIIGNVGTPTAIAALPIALANKTPFIAAFSGGGVLRKSPPDRYVINFRASYVEETKAMVAALMKHLRCKTSEVAFFTQRDGYGDAGFSGGIEALRTYGLECSNSVVHARYERNTLAVEGALAEILLHEVEPKAIIMVGAYEPCAKFIRLAKSADLNCLFLNVSFVGTAPLVSALGNAGENVIVTQVVPHPQSDLPLQKAFCKALYEIDPNAKMTFTAFEGYVASQILLRALRGSTEPVTRESLIRRLESLGVFDLGLGHTLKLTPGEHQASHRIWPTIIKAGQPTPFAWEELRAFTEDGPNEN